MMHSKKRHAFLFLLFIIFGWSLHGSKHNDFKKMKK